MIIVTFCRLRNVCAIFYNVVYIKIYHEIKTNFIRLKFLNSELISKYNIISLIAIKKHSFKLYSKHLKHLLLNYFFN